MKRIATTLLGIAALTSLASAAPQQAQSLRPAQPQAAGATSCKDTPKLVYGFNPPAGPLIQHVKVFDIFYSPGNTFKTKLEAYYTAITQSSYFDMLQEYNTTTYKISRGSFLASYEDTNSAAAAKTLPDAQVETYLTGLITAKKVPAPDDDTIYMIYFPSSVSITLPSGAGQVATSCKQFCAYHSSYTNAGGQLVRYGVIPDVTSAPCLGGCGPTTNGGFDSLTDVCSHELVEAVTDPDQGTGWYDGAVSSNDATNCGEIGDICATGPTTETATVAGYVVQNEFSNTLGCVASNPKYSVNDFSITTNMTVHVPQGGTAMANITLAKLAGTADNIALTAVTPPTGVTASFVPASVTSDAGKSVLTIAASATAMLGMAKLTVKGTGTNGTVSHTADINLVIDPPADMAMSPDLAQPSGTGGNGGNGGSGGSGGSGGNGNNGGGSSGCSMSGGDLTAGWAASALLLLALALRRRRA